MKIFITVMISIILALILAFVIILIIDRVIMNTRLKKIHAGMTGLEIQQQTKLKLRIISVEGDFYYARLTSPLRFFRYNLVFKDARLKEVGRI